MDASAHDLHGAAHFGKSRTCVIADSSSDGRQLLDLIVDRRQRIQGAEALIKGIIWKFFGFLMASVALRAGSDCQQGADSEKLRDPQGTSDFQTVSWNHAHPSRRRRRDFPSCGRASRAFGRLRLALPDRPQITGRLQFPAHLFSHLRGGVLRELVDDLCIFESF